MKFNFTSQICTSRSQSERLLALGLKKETADMCINPSRELIYPFSYSEALTLYDNYGLGKIMEKDLLLPAWSLHRLIEICGIDRMPISFHKKGKVRIRVNHIHPTHEGRSGYNHYNSLIDCIEWLIKEGYFNKEYLEK